MFYTRDKRNKIIKLNYITIKKIYSRMYCTPLTGPRSNSNDGWIPWNPSIGAAPKP